jgi:hypothetical protein
MHFSFLAYLRTEYARITEQTLNVAILEYCESLGQHAGSF